MVPVGVTIALFAMTGLSVWAWQVGRRLSAQTGLCSHLILTLSLLLSIAFTWCLAGKLAWAAVLPGGNVILWSNITPVLVAFVVGIATRSSALRSASRFATVASLSAIGLVFLIAPVTRPFIAPIQLSSESNWTGDICLQTHGSTCGAAAAATLLKHAGVDSSEKQMAAACLTSQFGTEPLGLYRGLVRGVRQNGKKATIASRDPDHWIGTEQLPCVALVQFDKPRFGTNHWFMGPRGEGHAVVVLGYTDGKWLIADPAVGEVRWNDEDFRNRFTGDAIYLAN
jgi:predicted double-glycine peptidase